MKKHWLKIIGFALVFVMIIGILSGCDNNGEADASSVVSSEISQNSEDESKDSEESSKNIQESDVSTEEPNQVFSVEYVTDYILEQYDSFFEFTDKTGIETIIFFTNELLYDFRFISITWETDDGFTKSNPTLNEVLYTIEELTSEKPLVIKNTYIHEIGGSYRGVIFKDQYGEEKYFYINYSGKDGIGLIKIDKK